MKKITTTILLFLALGSINSMALAQENDPICVHVIRHRDISPLLDYLFNKYGVEVSEQILLNMKNYEAEHEVFVLFSSEYNLLMERMNNLMFTASNQSELDRLQERIAKFVKFEDIEDLLN
jgi:hypothetical protein